MLIGLISDTHNLVRPGAVAALEGVEHIVHAGDVCRPDVLESLRKIAPLSVVRGNRDGGEWAAELPINLTLKFAGTRLHVVHILKDLSIDPAAEGVRVVLSGHSHRPGMHEHKGVLYVNPGSAGPRRFKLPISLARLRVSGGTIGIEFVVLE